MVPSKAKKIASVEVPFYPVHPGNPGHPDSDILPYNRLEKKVN
jgi:hypothetical protein